MSDLLKLFKEIHGELSGSCYLEVDEDETEVYVMKDGNLCWTASKVDLTFDYVINHIGQHNSIGEDK